MGQSLFMAARRPWTLFVSQKRSGGAFFCAPLGTLISCGRHREYIGQQFVGPAIPHRGPDLDAFLAIQPGRPLAEELEQVQVLVGEIQHHGPLSWDGEDVNPHAIMQDPPCRRGCNTSPLLIWEGRSVLLKDRTDAVFEGGIDESTHRHDHQQGHEALGVCAIERGGEPWRGFEEANPAFRLRVPLVSSEHRMGGQQALLQCVRREDTTALRVATRLAVRAPRREGAGAMGDALVRLGSGAWSPPLPIRWRGADGTLREKRGLQGAGTTRQGLVGIRFPGTGRAAQRPDSVDCLGTLVAPRRIDGALGLRLALGRVEKDPALRHTAVARWHHTRARARRERRPGLRIGLGQDGLGLGQGRGDPGDPRQAGLGQLLEVCGALEGPVGHQIGGVEGGVELRQVVADDLAARCALAPLATQGL
jgi:hypothetical protein